MTSLPAWSAPFADTEIARVRSLPITDIRSWGFAGATGGGVDVAVIDSGVDAADPRVGEVASAVVIEADSDQPEGWRAITGAHEDVAGHGTACAAIIRMLAPDARIHSVRVLGPHLKGQGALLRGGISWALRQGMHVANLSLSSKSEAMFGPLHEVSDAAYFGGLLLVAAANNQPGPTYPSQYASVISVAARPGTDPWALACNPRPPVEFGARGIDVEVAWGLGRSIVATGNSFAAPHVTGMVATLLSKHPGLTSFQVKAVLQALSENSDPAP